MKPIIAVTGAHGLIGSQFLSLFADVYDFETLDISHATNPVDITKQDDVARALENSAAQFVVHFAAFTDVTGAYKQAGDISGPAYQVNVVGTRNIVAACKKTSKHLIHISTAYVFDGDCETTYLETDPINPIEWYGHTKALAEEAVLSYPLHTILRIDQPFRSDTQVRPDVVRRIAAGLQDKTLYPQWTDHYFGPTFIDDFAKVLDWVIRTRTTGLFHATANEKWNDYDFSQAIMSTLKLSGEITRGTLTEYLTTINRPYQRNTALNSQKLLALLDFQILSVEEALRKVVL